MDGPELNTLVKRLERIERRQRVTVAAWVLSVVTLAVLGVGVQRAASQDSVIRAQRFVLVDDSGKTRAILGLDNTGSSGLWLKDVSGTDRVQIGYGGESNLPGLWIYDASRKTVARLGVDDNGGLLRIYDKGAQNRISLGMDGDNYPGLWLKDSSETIRESLGFSVESHAPSLWIYDASKKNRVQLGMTGKGTTALWLSDEAETTRAWIGVDPSGGPGVGIYDKDEKKVWYAPPSE
jgi:hypothetical protein